jgi:hypothetical protein
LPYGFPRGVSLKFLGRRVSVQTAQHQEYFDGSYDQRPVDVQADKIQYENVLHNRIDGRRF